jgi:cyclophilin family peptidyl-prolyl cis-trans isomerase
MEVHNNIRMQGKRNVRILYAVAISLIFLQSTTKGTLGMAEKKPLMEKTVVIITTNLGSIKLELYPDKAPLTVENFLKYVEEGYYKNTIFHRVIDGFMVQGGGFTPNLKQKETGETIKNEAHNGLSNKRGTIAMARTSEIHSATAQFFINVTDNLFLDYRGNSPHEYGYCVFGSVTEGMDIVDKIKGVDTHNQGPFKDLPVTPIEITNVERLALKP